MMKGNYLSNSFAPIDSNPNSSFHGHKRQVVHKTSLHYKLRVEKNILHVGMGIGSDESSEIPRIVYMEWNMISTIKVRLTQK